MAISTYTIKNFVIFGDPQNSAAIKLNSIRMVKKTELI